MQRRRSNRKLLPDEAAPAQPGSAAEPSRAARLQDVARLAGVSTATVSRAMNQPGIVSEDLRERIDRAIEHLNWVPHATARALATHRTHTVGVVVPTLANEHFATAIQTMQEALEQHGYTLFVACSEYNHERELRQVRKMIERNVDGLVLVGEAHHPELQKMLGGRSTPVISMFTWRQDSPDLCVGVDNYHAMFTAVDHLIKLGHRTFGMLVQNTDGNDRALARWNGAVDALAAHKLSMKPQHIARGTFGVLEGRELFRQVMKGGKHPTAVICANGSLAIGAALEADAMGLRIPDDLSLLGFDDLEVMAQLPTPLTAVRVPSAEIGQRTAAFLMARLTGTEEPASGEFQAELMLRASTGKPPGPFTPTVTHK